MKVRFPQRLLLASALVATLASQALSASPARTGDADWLSVRTGNFLVVGRGREREVRREAARLEQFHAVISAVFARLVGGERGGPHAPTTVILFPDDGAYAPYKPIFGGRPALGAAGHFQASAEVNYIALSLESERGRESSSTLFHEYTHLLLYDYFRAAPAWLKEGLAEFYSTARVSGGGVTLGGPLKAWQQLLRREGLAVPLDTVFAVDERSPHYQEDAKRAFFYAESWALVHYLLNGGGDARRAEFARYLELLASGEDAATSFRAAFAGGAAALERELASYVRLPSYPERVETFEGAGAHDFAAAAMTPPASATLAGAEVAAHFGDMLLRAGRDEEAEAHLVRALDADARTAAAAHVSLGVLRLRQARLEEATRLLRKAIALDPRNHLARFHLADALRREGVSGVITAADFDEKTRLISAELKRSIELAPDFLEAYKLFAHVELERGEQVAEAALLLERAIRLAPRRREFVLLLAQARIRTREYGAARELVAAATRRHADRRLLAHADKLLAVIAAREEEARKAEAVAARDPSAAGAEGAQPCDMPDAGPYHKRLRFKGQQVCGRLVEIGCEGDAVVLSIAAGERTLRLRGDALSRIRFVTYTTEVKTGHLSCGPRAPANPVLVTYRARKDKDAANGLDGEVIAVEFVPADWNR